MDANERLTSGAITQFAVLDALLAGTYESGITVADVAERGDFGLGCVDSLGGEVVILGGEAFECTVEGPPARMRADETMPFVDVCAWEDVDAAPGDAADLTVFTANVERTLVSRNLFHAVRFDGVVSATIRVTPRQRHPLPPLHEVTRQQVETVVDAVAGTLVGFWAPAIYQGITVAGLHLHFISDDRSVGGHVLEVSTREGRLRVAAYPRFHLHLPTDPLFLRTELTHDDDHRIVAVEGGVRS